jgi:hypothetical protein
MILRRVLRQEQITMDVIFGRWRCTSFFGIDFAILYDIIQRVDPSAFATTGADVGSAFYLSFMTLTHSRIRRHHTGVGLGAGTYRDKGAHRPDPARGNRRQAGRQANRAESPCRITR